MIVTREILSISNPSFRNIPETTVEDTARRILRFAARPVGQRSRSAEANRRAARAAQQEREKQARLVKEKALAIAAAAKERKETKFVIEKGGTKDVLFTEKVKRIGATKRALARAKARGQTRTVSRTAQRRGRGVEVTVVKTKKVKVAGKSCSLRANRSVKKLTKSEATCEVLSKGIQNRRPGQISDLRRIGIGASAIPINSKREAELLIKGNRQELKDAGVDSFLFGQAQRGLAVKFPTRTVQVGGGKFRRNVQRSALSGQDLVIRQSRQRLLFMGATNQEFDILNRRDKANSALAKRQSASLRSGGRAFGVAKPFFVSGGQFARTGRFGIGNQLVDERSFVRSGFGTKQQFKAAVERSRTDPIQTFFE